MSSPLLTHHTPLERALDGLTGDAVEAIGVPVRAMNTPETCPEKLLPWLAWALHVDNWDETASAGQKRATIRNSVALHRHKGTRWSLRQALSTLGIEAEIIDRANVADYAGQARYFFEAIALRRIDGSWPLDGQQRIKSWQLAQPNGDLPWPQFMVRINLASLDRTAGALIRAVVDEWKPVRAIPLFLYWMALRFELQIRAGGAAVLHQHGTLRYPWCGHVLSADQPTWRLGRDGQRPRIDSRRQLDGSWRIGQRTGQRAPVRITQDCRIVTTQTLRQSSTAQAYAKPAIGDSGRRLDGNWRLGAHVLDMLTATALHTRSVLPVQSAVDARSRSCFDMGYPGSADRIPGHPRLNGKQRLDGGWQIGRHSHALRLGELRIGRPVALLAEARQTLRITDAGAPVSPLRMTPTGTRIGTGVRIGGFMLARQRRIDGCWPIASRAAPEFRLRITH